MTGIIKKRHLTGSLRLLLVFSLIGSWQVVNSTASAQTYLFNKAEFSAGVNPVSVAAGDFNNDGRIDLAVANRNCPNNNCRTASISILMGKPDGTFEPPVDYLLGGPSIDLAVMTADFNGDGNRQGNTVSILLGNGDGTFRAHVDYPTGNFPQSVTTGDFNGDGKVDLAVANNNFGSNGSVSILLGNGDGTFQANVDYPTAGGAFSVITGDFNSDAKLDLAVTDGGFGNGLSLLLGKGDGTFQTAVRYASGAGAEGLTTADVNGDSTSDLVVTNQIDNTVSVLLGNGDGTFLSKHDYA